MARPHSSPADSIPADEDDTAQTAHRPDYTVPSTRHDATAPRSSNRRRVLAAALATATLADAVERGELTPTTTLGEVFGELEGTSAGELTMEQLATQHTGLPQTAGRIPLTQLWRVYLRIDGKVEDLPGLLDRAAGLDAAPGTYTYSNTGFALLGHAVAQAAGTPYPQLVHDRLLEPLGMEETIVPQTAADLPSGAPTGFSNTGMRTGPWTLGAEAPAGSIRSTTHDLAIWMGAVIVLGDTETWVDDAFDYLAAAPSPASPAETKE